MASLKEIAREYRDEIMDGIAWVAIWKTGRSWNAKAFWLNLETERIEDEEMEEAREIVAADPKAIFINEYYTAHMGEGKLDEIVEGIRFMYENEYNLLANNTAYAEEEQEGIRFEASEKMEEITTITKDLNQMDKNWKWSTKVEDRLNLPFPESVIEMHWGYLGYLEEPQDYFKVIHDQKKRGLPNARYVYVTEQGDKGRWHHHIVLDGDMDMDTVESLWTYGKRNQVRRLQKDENGLVGMAKYVSKPKGKGKDSEEGKYQKIWTPSKNLKKPDEHKNHYKTKQSHVDKMVNGILPVQEHLNNLLCAV